MTFRLPPYPYDRLGGLAKLADAHPGGMVDCSIGTPCDPPPPRRRRRAGVVGHRARLSRLRRQPAAARGRGRLADAGASGSARCPAWRPRSPPAWGPRSWSPRCRTCSGCASRTRTRCCTPPCPTRRTPWAPSSPGCRAVAVPPAPGRLGRSRPRRHRRRRRGPGPGAVVELAVEPDRRPGRPRRRGRVGPGARCPGVLRRVLRRVHLGRPTALGAPARPRRRGGRALAVQALEPGRRARRASTPATPSWSSSCGPCASTPASWSRARPRPPAWSPWPTTSTSSSSGRATGSGWPTWPTSSTDYGCPVGLPEGGFYLWVPVPRDRWPDAWAMAEALATDGGLLVSPGDLYGETVGAARARRRGPADGAVGAGGGAPR